MERDPYDAVLPVVDRGFDALRRALAPFMASPRPNLAVATSSFLTRAEAEWVQVQAALSDGNRHVVNLRNTTTYDEDAVRQQVNDAKDTLRTEVETRLAAIAAGVADLRAAAAAALLPSRPAPIDATQETAITNLKTDLRMVLDAVAPSAVPGQLASLASSYAAAGDALAAWLLLATSWPSMYIQSRGAEPALWTAQLNGLLNALAGDNPNRELAARLLPVLDDPRGFAGATAAMRGISRQRLSTMAA